MPRKTTTIPVNPLPEESGVFLERATANGLYAHEAAGHAHRHNFHFFLLIGKGSIGIEIDFERQLLKAPGLLYVHPSQVHRILKIHHADGWVLGMSSDTIKPDYLQLLEQSVAPARTLPLKKNAFELLQTTLELAAAVSRPKNEEGAKTLMSDYANAFVGLVIRNYRTHSGHSAPLSRFDQITKVFKQQLEQQFLHHKRPSDYASLLGISTPYLNECVRTATGFPVSYHIQQRVILEAKRLLVHSDHSVKEIALELGYEDYAYFSRLFTKVAGTTAMSFRSKKPRFVQ